MTEQLRVEIGFDSIGGEPFPKWYDVTPYVSSGKTKRGRSYEVDNIETGSADYTLDNATGMFTPGSTRSANPYAGKVVPGKPIRTYILADDNWIHYESVSPANLSGDGPRFTRSAGSSVAVHQSPTLNRPVWELTGSTATATMYAGLAQDSDYLRVTTGQTVTAYGLVANGQGTGTREVSIGISFAPTSNSPSFTTVAASTKYTDVDVYHATSVTWTATTDGFVRVAVIGTSTANAIIARAVDLKLTVGGIGSAAVAAISGMFPQFRGTIDRWSQEYSGFLSKVTVECVDGLAEISDPAKTRYRGAVNTWYTKNVSGASADGQFWYWPVVEKENPWATNAEIGQYPLSKVIGAIGGSDSAGFTDAKTMAKADGESGGFTINLVDRADGIFPSANLTMVSGYNPPLPEWTVSLDVDFWVNVNSLPPDPGNGAKTGATVWMALPAVDRALATAIMVYSDGSLTYVHGVGDNSLAAYNTVAGLIKPGIPAHIGMRVDINVATKEATVTAYLDGKVLGTRKDTVTTKQSRPEIPRFERVTFGQECGGYGPNGIRIYDRPLNGTINHCMFALGAPSGFHMSVHDAGTDNNVPEVTRLNQVLDAAGWSGPRRFDPALSTLLPAEWEMDADGGELLVDAAEFAGGVAYVAPSGEVTYHNRQRRISPPVRWTVQEWTSGLRFQLDSSRVRNEIKAERSTGLFRVARDDASIKMYGRKPMTVKRDVVDPNEIADAAAWLLRRYRVAAPWCDTLKIDACTLNATTDGTLKALAYGADVSQRLQFVGLPADAPADTCDFFIDGIESSFVIEGSVMEWTTTLSVSDVGNSTGWVLDDDTSGFLDSDGCVLIY